MNRFRKKGGGTKKVKSSNGVGVGGDNDSVNSRITPIISEPFPLLPNIDNRTSLILPHLTRRFTLLRKEDGKLVSLEEMQLHLAAQRRTGMLTSSQADEFLVQYNLQSQHEHPLPTPRTWPVKKRRDWSLVTGGGEDSEESFEINSTRRIDSFISTTENSNSNGGSGGNSNELDHLPTPISTSTSNLYPPTLLNNSLNSNSFASTSNSQPFPYSSESYYSLPAPTPVEPIKVEPYKRGAGNSMFGGRVRQMKVSKSPSSFSLKSAASASSKKSFRTTQTIDTTEGENDTETGDDKSSRTRDSLSRTEDEAELTDSQDTGRLKSLSLGLDDIESELSKTYLRMTNDNDLDDEEQLMDRFNDRPLSPISDSEAIDPFLHRIRASPITSNFSLRSPSTSSTTSPITPSSFDNPTLEPPSRPFAHSTSSSLNTLSPSDRDHSIHGSERDVSTPVQQNSTTSRTTSPTQLTRTFNSPSFTHPFEETRSRIESQSYSNHSLDSGSLDEFPDSYSFPTPSSRDNSLSTRANSTSTRDNSISDEGGPFDLASARGSLASKGSLSSRSKQLHGMDNRRRVYAANSSISTGPSSIILGPFRNSSMSSVGSVGSSYHPASTGSNEEDESGLPKESLLSTEGGGGEENKLELLQIPDLPSPFNRSISKEELLQDLRSNNINNNNNNNNGDINLGGINGEEGGGEEENVSIEVEDLVLIQESLVKSASRRAALRAATPSSLSGSSPSLNSHNESRKHSIETGEGGNSSNPNSRKPSVDNGLINSSRKNSESTSRNPSFDQRNEEKEEEEREEIVEGNSTSRNGQNYSHQQQQSPTLLELRRPSESSVLSVTPSSWPTPSSIDSREFTSAVSTPFIDPLPLEVPDIILNSVVEDNFNIEPVLRSPLPSRSPIARQSVLIRDVKQQANNATMNLKSKTSPNLSNTIKRKKSVRNIPISNPQFISGPTGIASVPILNPSFELSLPPRSRSPKGLPPKLGPKSPGRLVGTNNNGIMGRENSIKPGIGSRFKKLLSKPSRDQLNGDEVTPFVSNSSNGVRNDSISPPFSPPPLAGAESSFASSPRSPPSTSPSMTPEVPALPEAYRNTPVLSTVTETLENESPSSNKSLSRVLSRFKTSTNRRPSDTSTTPIPSSPITTTNDKTPMMNSSPVSTIHGRSPISRGSRSSSGGEGGGEVLGLGLGLSPSDGGSRAPVTYDVGSMRRSRRTVGKEIDYDDLPQTAPLSLPKSSPMENQQILLPHSAPLDRNMLEEIEGDGIKTPSLSDSITQLTEVNQFNSTRQDVILNGQSLLTSDQEDNVENDNDDLFTPTVLDFRNPDSANRSFQERVSTPPPTIAHRRKISSDLQSTTNNNNSISKLSEGSSLINKKLSVIDQKRFSRLSVDTKGSNGSLHTTGSPRLLPPRSPGENSIRSYRSQESSYAGSVFDFYGDDEGNNEIESEDGGAIGLGVGNIGVGLGSLNATRYGQSNMMRMEEQNGSDYPAQLDAEEEDNEDEERDILGQQDEESNVWTVVDDLRKHRLSTNSNQSQSDPSYAFHSRQSSQDSAASFYPPPSNSTTSPTRIEHLNNNGRATTPSSIHSVEPPHLYLRHQHRKNRSSQSNIKISPSLISSTGGRFPSIYVRDEKRLDALEGGIAQEEHGSFFTRSIGVEELERLKELRRENKEEDERNVEGEKYGGGDEEGEGYREEEVVDHY